MSAVFFRRVGKKCGSDEVSAAARAVLEALLQNSTVGVDKELLLKVHFGERGNRTYLKQDYYSGIIDFLTEQGCSCKYSETSVLYGGERFSSEKHIKLALSHGFDRLPIEIADGDNGGSACQVPVKNGKHFQFAAIAEKLAIADQTIVLSHFKGHMLAGFGGALKQLSMGFAAKGGKMAMHLGVKPRIIKWKCRNCGLCMKRCNEQAISRVGKKCFIDQNKCIGCGACFSICPHHAVSVFTLKGIWHALFKGRFFREKLAEYASASHSGKRNIYINFVINVTPGCDCEPRPMFPCVDDIGIFASMDPVAVDSACYDAVARAGKRFRGKELLSYAEKIGVGSTAYELTEV